MNTTLKGSITNVCSCVTYNDDLGEWENAPECWGDCWDYAVEDFGNVTEELRNSNETGWWKVTDLRLWNGNVSGYFPADTVAKLLEGMTVRSAWNMTYEVFPDRIEYSLSHHDSPMGSASTLTAVTEEERGEWGLY